MFYVWHNGHRLDQRFNDPFVAQSFAIAHCREGEVAEVRDEAGSVFWSSEGEQATAAEERTED